jgi:hypothetical protein
MSFWRHGKTALEVGEHAEFIWKILDFLGFDRPINWLLYIAGGGVSGYLADMAYWSPIWIFLAVIGAGVGLSLVYAAIHWLPRGTPNATEAFITQASPVLPLNRDPYDETVPWALRQIEKTAAFTGKLDSTPDELRQAARSGTITIYGRPESNHMTADNFYKPIEPIKPEHWRDFGFSAIRCLCHEDTRECRTEPDDARSARYGEAYVDLRVNSAEIKARWPETNPSIDRIPCTEMLRIATSAGWDFNSHNSLHLMDLQDAMRQGGLDGIISVWGRQNQYPQSEKLMKQEPLDKIPVDHWREFRAHLYPMVSGNNFDTKTWRAKKTETEVGYIDLHVDRGQASAWLKGDALSFRGKTKS